MKIPERLSQVRVEELRERAIVFWRWWTAELMAMVPQNIREKVQELFRDNTGTVSVDVANDMIVVSRTAGGVTAEILRLPKEALNSPNSSAAEAVNNATHNGDKVTVRVPATELLRRMVKLPMAASRNLKNILKFELERVSPLDPEQISFDYRLIGRDKEANRLDVELRILKREIADKAVAVCRALGLEPQAIGFSGESKQTVERDFPVTHAATLLGQWQSWRVPALSALVAVLGIGALLATYSREQDTLDALSDQITGARSRAMVVQRLQDEINKANLGIAFLARQKQSPLLVKILAEVTRILPDNTWLVEFELNGKEIRLHGYSPAASSLIALFDNSQLFTNAQFRSPLMQGQNGLDRFDLSFDVKGGAT